MNKIPVTFDYKNKSYKTTLSAVSGAGGVASMFHLFVNNYFCGQLIYSEDQKRWFFYAPNRPEMELLAYHFAEQIINHS